MTAVDLTGFERVPTELTSPNSRSRVVATGGDASFPAVSPSGDEIAFVSYRQDAGGDILILRLTDGQVYPLTSGPALDIFPSWSADGRSIYFSRVMVDTNGDGEINLKDNAAVYRIPAVDRNWAKPAPGDPEQETTPPAYPLTSFSYPAIYPQIGGAKLFFLSSRKAVSNLWALPLEGEIPTLASAAEQFRLAEEIARQIPPDPLLAVLAYSRVLEKFGADKSLAGQAAYIIGKLYLAADWPVAAETALDVVTTRYGQTQPWAALALIEQRAILTRRQWALAGTVRKKESILQKSLAELAGIADQYRQPALIPARSKVEQAQLLLELGNNSKSLLAAIKLLDRVMTDYPSERSAAAQAAFLRAEAYHRVGMADRVDAAYLAVIDDYGDVAAWADRAVERILETATATPGLTGEDTTVRRLQKIAAENRHTQPSLSMGALNRIGDIFYATDEWDQAKGAYRQVLDQFRQNTTQRAAARLALAEILYREERFSQALELYEREIGSRPYEDQIYRLARAGYIKKSVEAGEYLYRLGEISSARTIFKDLLVYDDAVIEAHRGYIKCAAAQNDISRVREAYRQRLNQHPQDPIGLYATGLCLTYLNQEKALTEAEGLISQAIAQQGQVEYYHQTLGYVREVLETVYGRQGRLELAVESYQKAYFLNDPKRNAGNAANLLLNLGNGYYLLGQHRRAFQFYSQRLEAQVPFDDIETEILFYRRLGASAFQVRETAPTIQAFTTALALTRTRLDPHQASEAFDRFSRYAVDRIITPASQAAPLARKAKALAQRQSDINRRRAQLVQQEATPPPGSEWQTYKKAMEGLLAEQQRLNRDLVALGNAAASLGQPRSGMAPQGRPQIQQDLESMVRRITAALELPERLLQLRAELLDRLGLAYQEAGDWKTAAETFEEVFGLNQRLELFQNLGRNRRSVAYNLYMQAGLVAGTEQQKLLEAAAADFAEAAALVDRYGVARPPRKGAPGGLVNISLEVALDTVGATQAAYGFSAAQEKRLAEAFIGRIKTELGEVVPAYDAVQRQLSDYPADKPVADPDVYGVSLLYHRAGHLAVALGKSREGFEHFRRSALLSLRMGQGVSAAISVSNMAHLLARMSPEVPELSRHKNQVEELDRKVTPWLARTPSWPGIAFDAVYHNTMGVYYLRQPSAKGDAAIEEAVAGMRTLQQAATHFLWGLKGVEPEPSGAGIQERRQLYMRAGLHLNMAQVASALGEPQQAVEHLRDGLDVSRRGLFPDLEWRALARLGRLEEALQVLATVTVLRAGCDPQEIVTTFAPLVADRVHSGETESAFNLVERLSEIERVNRLAPLLIGSLPENEKNLYLSLYPRLLGIRDLRQKIAASQGEEKDYLTDRLNRELELVSLKIGKNREKVPTLAALCEKESTQDQIIILLGLAIQAEEIAEKLVTSPGDTQALREQYQTLLAKYRSVLETSRGDTPEFEPEGVIALFGPRPVEAIDVMEGLPEEGSLLRLYPSPAAEARFLAFHLTADEIKPAVVTAEELEHSFGNFTYLAYEDPAALPVDQSLSYVFSATHLMRSIRNRKPFKQSLLALASSEIPAPEGQDADAYAVKTISLSAPANEILEALPGIHTLLVASPVGLFASVPTRSGKVSENIPGVQLGQGRTLPLRLLAGRLSGISLVLLPESSLQDAYAVGHLLALYGCPAVVLPRDPAGDAAPFVRSFLTEYRRASTGAALKAARAAAGSQRDWILLGDRGMTADEAARFAQENFVRYVQRAQVALEADQPLQALALFENALVVARATEGYQQYLPDLYRYSRESAYRGGNLEKALQHAQSLAVLMAEKAPDSEFHGEALLRLGLLQSRLERYDQAVPTLEESLAIMSNLENYDQEIMTLDSIGVVLENATEYDRALDKFISAARLSQSQGQQELLAQQYINIGRIYDLRLSQYARAKTSYTQALNLYQESGQRTKVAQTLVDVGRCDRLLGNFSAADRHYNEALKLVTADQPENLQLKSRIIIEQANNAWFQARYEEAFRLQQQTLQLARQDHWPLGQVMALNTSGLIWWTLADNQRALRELEDALKLARQLEMRSDEVATTLNNIGLIYREMGRYEKALETFDQALAIDQKARTVWHPIGYDVYPGRMRCHLRAER
ncbi:MAG: tetratricopeptide repeat protein [Desulfobacterales bacterium]|nr:MAG: tetratricopeptide repeat protein [Desulfobacterales bacterium]